MSSNPSQGRDARFQLLVPDSKIAVFFAALQYLQRISKEMILEVGPRTVILRALNDNKSAFSSIEFSEFGTFSASQSNKCRES